MNNPNLIGTFLGKIVVAIAKKNVAKRTLGSIILYVICLQQTVAKVAPVVETRPRFPQNPLPFFMDWSDAFVAIANLVADGILTQS